MNLILSAVTLPRAQRSYSEHVRIYSPDTVQTAVNFRRCFLGRSSCSIGIYKAALQDESMSAGRSELSRSSIR